MHTYCCAMQGTYPGTTQTGCVTLNFASKPCMGRYMTAMHIALSTDARFPKKRATGKCNWIGLDLFNDDTCPSGHISCPTQVNVSQSCFNSLNILLKLDYIVQVWGLVEVNCVISDRIIPFLAGIPLCKSRELSRRGYSMSQLCSIHHGIPVTLHTPGAYGQWSVFNHNGDR